MTQAVVLLALTVTALALASWRVSHRLKPLLAAPASARGDRMGQRLTYLLPEIGLHRRLRRLRLSGTIHVLVFVSFFVLLTAILQAYAKVLWPTLGRSDVLAVLQDVFAVAMLIGVGLALYNRLVIRPERFVGSNKRDALVVLALIATIVVAMELEFAFQQLSGAPGLPYHPVASLLAEALAPIVNSPKSAKAFEAFFYWLHIAAILGFLVYLPGSKHFHMFVGIPNLIFRNLGPRGRLPDGDLSATTASGIDALPWKGMLDLYSCTECGRCQAVCPAYAAGLPLSPKSLIMDLRDHLVDRATGDAAGEATLADSVIAADTLWSCTTCFACMEACPLHIEHVPKIVDMRRDLVNEGALPPSLQNTLTSVQRYGNSFKKPARQRPKWTKQLDFEIPDAQEEAVEFLWFVGDYASYHPLVVKRTQAIAGLLQRAGVSFGILYEREKNSGNDIRRIGEEGLFQELAEENAAAIAQCRFRKIVTTDPHSLNALTNEYGAFGLKAEVLHYTELLDRLMRSGALSFESNGRGRIVTYHDPCYLGRYNARYEAPRNIIHALGYELQDMRRCRENSFCCGAGGGRIFMEDESTRERPSENRIREALEIEGVEHFVVTCPKDIVMYSAAVETLGVGGRIAVKEISELFACEDGLDRSERSTAAGPALAGEPA